MNAATGETLVREQVEAESRERVLGRLGEARPAFGRSWASRWLHREVRRSHRAGHHSSLEAFKAYDLGRQQHFGGQYFEAIPLYRRAVELDPNFAIAYAALGITYGTAREYDLAAQFSRRAFELRERVSEREQFYISARYYMDVLDDGDSAIEALELWNQTYPRDFVPRTNLSARYARDRTHPKALEEARDGVRLNPDAGVAYAALAHSSICLGRHQDARAALDQAMARKLDPPYSRYMLYGIAILQGNTAAMQQQVDRAQERQPKPGCWRCNQWRRPIRAGCAARGTTLYARSSWPWGAASQKVPGSIPPATPCGKRRMATAGRPEQTAARTLGISQGRDALSWSALALAICGDSNQGQKAPRRDGPPISRGLVLQGLVAADGARGAVAP